ncbi:hypothetical protein SCHPADRAFT_835306, partial [Schizopora paradoxa]
WLSHLEAFETILNHVLALTAPVQHDAGIKAQQKIREDPKHVLSDKARTTMQNWPSVFTGISVISNRTTPPHRDTGGSIYDFDILASTGTHKKATLHIQDTGLKFGYQPGVVVVLLGKLLRHSVPSWSGGERVCYAHFMRGNVLDRYSHQKRSWIYLSDYPDVVLP